MPRHRCLARVVAGECEYQREQIAKQWLGQVLPNWTKPSKVVVTFGWGDGVGSTALTFADAKTGRRLADIEIRVDGLTLESLEVILPREIAFTVLATHFGKPVPRWAGSGIARLHEPVIQQAEHDSLIRQLLNAGRGVRLKVLFRMTDYPQDMTHFHAQVHSVCRFLLSAGHSRAALLEFVGNGMGMNDNNADGWDRAAKALGYKSVDSLEDAWLSWLQKPESRLKTDSQPSRASPDDQFDRIPPVKLPGSAPPGRP